MGTRIIIGGKYYNTLNAHSMHIQRSASDPIPTCTLELIDNSSSLTIVPWQEMIVIDDNLTTNPTINLAINPTFNPYNSNWFLFSATGFTNSQNTGGGLVWTLSNTTVTNQSSMATLQLPPGSVAPGVTYIFSVNAQGGSTPTNVGAGISFSWFDAGGNAVGSTPGFFGPVPVSTSLVQYTCSGTAPSGASYAVLSLLFQKSSTTNSGTITWTNAQFEPEWFPTQTYPTPFCGPAQTNCQQLPLGYWVRQYRRFAGFITRPTAVNYHGNVRTLQIDASGYACLLSLVYCNDSFTSQTDKAIITSLLNKYLVENSTVPPYTTFNLTTQTNVIAGQTLADFGSNWDDLRTLFNTLAGTTTFYWTIDYYWNMIYAPLGYFNQGIGLICDNSSQPDNVTTFPAYGFSAETDGTQPGSTILCLGSGSNVSLVYDLAQIAQIGQTSGYYLPIGSSWMRKVNDANLQSTTDTTNRALAELQLYDFPRAIYHLKANVELIPGQSVQLTSATEGLTNSAQLVQRINATWLGTTETLDDEWEYHADLGAVNRGVTDMISQLHRKTQQNTSAPAIASTTLAVVENALNYTENISTSITLASNYFATVQTDAPVALYMLGEITGTIADDTSGLVQQGTIGSGVTQGATGILLDAADSSLTAMLFSSGSIALPSSGTWPTGHGTWTVEAWCKPTNATNARNGHLVTIGNPGTNAAVAAIVQTSTGGWGVNTWGGAGHDFGGNGTSTAGTIYYVAATYDGSTNCDLYVGTGGSVTHYGPFNAGTLVLTTSANQAIGDAFASAIHNYFAGSIQAVGVYTTNLSSARITAHYNAGH